MLGTRSGSTKAATRSTSRRLAASTTRKKSGSRGWVDAESQRETE